MEKGWMVRAGEGGRLFEDFGAGYIAIGWSKLGDLNSIGGRDQLAQAYAQAFSEQKPSKQALAVGTLYKFRDVMQRGDVVVTYDPSSRQYLVGKISGDYVYSPETVGDYPNIRPTKWLGKISRDYLRQSTKNSLGSVMTMFAVKSATIREMLDLVEGKQTQGNPDIEPLDEQEVTSKDDIVNQSRELIKDRLNALDPEEMEHLVAAVFRAMGYRARVSPKGPDRGVDVIASPDGLGLQEPRIKAEVKHRSGSMGSQSIRSFIGALRPGDRGVYVSTGGFSREARYEAERANIPISLVDIDELASLVVDFYGDFDLDGKALIPLVGIYWPADL
ncbi:restriction endonuclease [Haliea sp. E1-2-M8]|uniref:restriction endonuclease n=1 Tax=Haliea sp. E1-2-M8 TaxID=3064706 RepID=UPI002728DCFA|nr:restriction endonuclease [Haliea sp. E1-2-M8]MDO8864092.1 restriction endonuclease [Haliea sp. E1-2-M8]